MQDNATLRQRIEQAANGLSAAEIMRRERKSSLGDKLAKVEERFGARKAELGYLQERVGELEAANQGLIGAIETFSQMIAEESESQIESALYRASAGARELLAAIESGILAPQLRQPEPAPDQRLRFEDVSQADLDAEELAGFPADDGIAIPEMAPVTEIPAPSGSFGDLLVQLHRRAGLTRSAAA